MLFKYLYKKILHSESYTIFSDKYLYLLSNIFMFLMYEIIYIYLNLFNFCFVINTVIKHTLNKFLKSCDMYIHVVMLSKLTNRQNKI